MSMKSERASTEFTVSISIEKEDDGYYVVVGEPPNRFRKIGPIPDAEMARRTQIECRDALTDNMERVKMQIADNLRMSAGLALLNGDHIATGLIGSIEGKGLRMSGPADNQRDRRDGSSDMIWGMRKGGVVPSGQNGLRPDEVAVQLTLSDQERANLSAGILIARNEAALVGPMQSLWDAILDAECLLAGKPTILRGDVRTVYKKLMKMLYGPVL